MSIDLVVMAVEILPLSVMHAESAISLQEISDEGFWTVKESGNNHQASLGKTYRETRKTWKDRLGSS